MKNNSLKALMVVRDKLSNANREQMFNVFEKYYANSTREIFFRDLDKKDKVILLIESNNGMIVGFSTILEYSFDLNGKKVRGVFSGDTILEKAYWGGTALQVAFTKYLTWEKIKSPWTDYYWFLICKGYRTYLLMANNFIEYYPRYDAQTPAGIKTIMEQFAKGLYGDQYNPESGLITFEELGHDYLKCDVAPITKAMLQKSAKIDFFARANPTWQKGSELVCIGRYDAALPWRMFVKTLTKFMQRKNKEMIIVKPDSSQNQAEDQIG